jgi:hypothetical protein
MVLLLYYKDHKRACALSDDREQVAERLLINKEARPGVCCQKDQRKRNENQLYM